MASLTLQDIYTTPYTRERLRGHQERGHRKKMLEPEVWSENQSSPLNGTGRSHYTRPSAVVTCTRPAHSWSRQHFVVKQGKVHKTPSVPEGLRRDLFNLSICAVAASV